MENIKQRLEEQIKKTPIRFKPAYPLVKIDIHTVSELETILKYDIQQIQRFTNDITLYCCDNPIECAFTCFIQTNEFEKSLYTTTINQDTLEKMLETILQYLETRKAYSKFETENVLEDEIAEIESNIDDLLDDKTFLTKKLYDLQGKTILDEETNKRLEYWDNVRTEALEYIKKYLETK